MHATNSSGQLLPLRPILEWLPGETLFSLCSRYHHIAGHRIPAQSCRALFGTPRAGSAHDIPSHVQTLIDRTDAALGKAREIILDRTLLPFYFPFHPVQQCENWVAQMTAGSSANLKAQMGLAASQFGASHPLKACPACMQSDANEHGVAYWHVDHQVPGVLVCLLHRTPLLTATDKVSGQDRFGWVLPGQAHLESVLGNHVPSSGEYLLAEGALALWRLPISFTFAQDRLSRLYKAKLVEQDFVHATSSRVDIKRFEQALSGVLEANSMANFWPWLSARNALPSLSRRLLRISHPTSPRFSRHPLNHLLLVILLFGSWKHFWAAYQVLEIDDGDGIATDVREMELEGQEAADPKASLRASLIEKVRSGQSVSHAAQLTGVAVATAMAWAASEGIQSPRRPKVLKPDVRLRLVQQLQRGTDKTVAASLASISVQTVTRFLMTEPGLHTQWSTARFNKAQKRARGSWQTIRHSFPEAPSNEWRKLDPAAYAWLYRNDRLWLQRSIQDRPQSPTTSVQRRDWQERDASLAHAVRVAALDWYVSHPGKRPTIGVLCAAVAGLRPKMSALSKLPLTRKAIQEACSDSCSTASTSQKWLSEDDTGF